VLNCIPDRVDQPDPVGVCVLLPAPGLQTVPQKAQLLAHIVPAVRFGALALPLTPLPFLALLELMTQIVDGALEPVEFVPEFPMRFTGIVLALTLTPLSFVALSQLMA